MAMAKIDIAVLAKAPVAGLAKTRLIPALGAEGAAALQARLIAHTIEVAHAAGNVTLWVTPDERHPAFRNLPSDVSVKRQPEGDLGARMLAAAQAVDGPVLIVGTDCPALTAAHLKAATAVLHQGNDAVVIPADDGGYVLIGMNLPQPALFENMQWSTPAVMEETRRRLRAAYLGWREPARLWDVDEPADLERLGKEFPELL
jgi:rSAM/selenodomain-associated transferase 1